MSLNIVFAGTSEFALVSLQALLTSDHNLCAILTQPDRPAGRGLKLTASPVKQLALQHDLTILQPDKLTNDAIASIRNLGADIMVVVSYGLLIPERLLTTFKYGCINIHPSLLPKWRGAAPIQRAMLAGDKVTGVSIIQLDAGLDDGDILAQEKIKIADTDTYASLEAHLAQLGTELLMRTLDDIESVKVKPVPQDDNLSSYAKKITHQDTIINWQQDAKKLLRQINALHPKPGANASLQGKTIKILAAEALTIAAAGIASSLTEAPVGTIIKADKYGIDVLTGSGILRLLKLQFPGSRGLQIQQVLNSKRDLFKVGNKFDVIR